VRSRANGSTTCSSRPLPGGAWSRFLSHDRDAAQTRPRKARAVFAGIASEARGQDQRITGLLIEDGLLSYASIARTPIHRQIFDAIVPGVLGVYDLPDSMASLAPRPVQLVNVRSPMGNVAFLPEVRSEYAYAQAGYVALGFAARLRLGRRREGASIAAANPDLR